MSPATPLPPPRHLRRGPLPEPPAPERHLRRGPRTPAPGSPCCRYGRCSGGADSDSGPQETAPWAPAAAAAAQSLPRAGSAVPAAVTAPSVVFAGMRARGEPRELRRLVTANRSAVVGSDSAAARGLGPQPALRTADPPDFKFDVRPAGPCQWRYPTPSRCRPGFGSASSGRRHQPCQARATVGVGK